MRTSSIASLRMALVLMLLTAGTLVALTGPAVAPANAAGATEVMSFGTNPGALKMFRCVPAGLPAGAPVVVAEALEPTSR